MLRLTGLADVVGGNQMRNPTKGGNTTAVMQKYMGELTCEQVERLQARYQPDLTLFQYSMDQIFQWARGGEGCGTSQ